jgi:hypothetical protein
MWRATRVLLLAVLCSACGNGGGGGGSPDGGATGDAGDAGIPKWPVKFGLASSDAGPGGDPRGIATDSAGNVYVSGQFLGATSFIAKFSAAGKKLWDKSYSIADFWGIAVDSLHGGAIYVAGTKQNFPTNAPLLLKLDLDGKLQWTQELTTTKPVNAPPTTGGAGVAVAVDSNGNPIIAGISDSPTLSAKPAQLGETDLFIAKYDASGASQWITMLGTGNGTSASNLISVAADSQGNLLLSSEGNGAVGGQSFAGGLGDILLAKFDGASGKSTWVRERGTSVEDGAYGVAVDGTGNAYVAGFTLGAMDGQTNPSVGFRDAVLLKYDSSGNWLWTRQIGSSYDDDGLGVGLDPKEQPIMAGISFGDFDGHKNASPSGAGGNQTPIAVEYDPAGNKLWSNEFGDGGGNATTVDSKGDTFVVGTSDDDNLPLYIVRFGPSGQVH